MEVIGWAIWGVLALGTLSLWLGIIVAFVSGQRSTFGGALIQGVLFLLTLAVFYYVPDWIWLAPLIFFFTPFLVDRILRSISGLN
jgi:hypothetical protein